MPLKTKSSDTLRYVRQTADAQGVKHANYEEDLTVNAAESGDEWVNLDVRSSKESEAYINKYRSFTDMNHRVAYEDLQAVERVRLLDEDGTLREYTRQPIATDNKYGLEGWILKPINTPAGEIPKVKVVFKGTDPTSLSSVACNAERGGSGAESFARNRDAILSQINNSIAEYDKVTLDIGGHSKGNALASYCAAAVREGVAQNLGLTAANPISESVRDNFHKIQTMRLSGNNGTGVNHTTATRNADVVGYIAEQRQKGRTKLTLESYKFRRDGDGVQQTGETELDAGVPYEHVQVDVMKVHGTKGLTLSLPAAAVIGTAGFVAGGAVATVAGVSLAVNAVVGVKTTMSAHMTNIFDKANPPAAYTYERFSNQKQPNAVTGELNKKSGWLNRIQTGVFAVKDGVTSVLSGASLLFGRMANAFSGSKRAPEPVIAPVSSLRNR